MDGLKEYCCGRPTEMPEKKKTVSLTSRWRLMLRFLIVVLQGESHRTHGLLVHSVEPAFAVGAHGLT